MQHLINIKELLTRIRCRFFCTFY